MLVRDAGGNCHQSGLSGSPLPHRAPLRPHRHQRWSRSVQSPSSSFLRVPNLSQRRKALTSSRTTGAAAMGPGPRGWDPVSVCVVSQPISTQPRSFRSELPIISLAQMPTRPPKCPGSDALWVARREPGKGARRWFSWRSFPPPSRGAGSWSQCPHRWTGSNDQLTPSSTSGGRNAIRADGRAHTHASEPP